MRKKVIILKQHGTLKKGSAIKNPCAPAKNGTIEFKKLDKTEKTRQKIKSKIKKKLKSKDDAVCLRGSLNPMTIPQLVIPKEEVEVKKKLEPL